MALESGANVDITYVVESTHGVTPGSPSMTVLRATTRNVNPQKNLLRSEELRADRLQARPRHGFRQFSGQIGFELCNRAFDDILEGLTGGTWAAVTGTPATTLSVTAPSTYTRGSGSFVTDGFKEGDIVTVSGFTNAANNGQRKVASVTALSLVVAETTLVNETGGGDEAIAYVGKRLMSGSTLKTFTLERRFKGITQFQVGVGVAFNNMAFNLQPEQMAGGTIDVIGMNFLPLSGTSLDDTPTAAATDAPFNAFDGVLYEGSTLMAVVTGLSFTYNNNRALQAVIFSDGSPDVFEGTSMISGTMTALFESAALYNKFINETPSVLDVRMDNPNGTDFMRFRIPVIYTGANIDPPQQGPVPLSMPFEAYPDDTTLGTNFMVQRSNA